MSANNFNELNNHYGHALEVVRYEYEGEIVNASLECVECNEVLLDYEKENQ
jgi:hypothetical protein